MSTKVTTAHPEMHPGTHLSLDAYTSEKVNVGIGPGRIAGMHLEGINVPRADLLAAVSSELGVVIIDKRDLPEVVEQRGYGNDHLIADAAVVAENDASDLWRKARSFIALALHRDSHPPVDAAQVGALAGLLRTALGVTPETIAAGALQLGSSDDIARRLIATGKVEVRS